MCTDTITGLYSAIHDAWKEKRDSEAEIEITDSGQRQLFCEYKVVEESRDKALRLERMIKRYLGYNAYWDIYLALLSDDPEKGTAVFRAMQESRRISNSRKIMEHLGNSDVARVFAMSRQVSNEAHMYEEVIRFRELENGVLFSEIAPKSQVLTCIADHFADRFPLENWMIYDKTHECFSFTDNKRSGLLYGEKSRTKKTRTWCRSQKKSMPGSGQVFLILFLSGRGRIPSAREIIFVEVSPVYD